MPSRAVTSFLHQKFCVPWLFPLMCQCPLGLLPHFYPLHGCHDSLNDDSRVNALSGCYLISTNDPYVYRRIDHRCVNALSGCYLISTQEQQQQEQLIKAACQCPLGLLPHFYSYEYRIYNCRLSRVNALSGCYLISTQMI